MGTFTMPLKTVIELEPDIGLNDYPIFDEEYRTQLNQKIIDHYWNQEIGMETISMFRHAMKRRMNEIMPLYNQHYKLSLIDIDPLSTVSVKSITAADGTNTASGTSSNNSGSNAKSRSVASDTPQTQLNPTQDYASSMQDNISDSAATGEAKDERTETSNGTTDNTQTGYQGHAPLLILQARQALVNVDMLVISELQDLFMLIWSTNDEYSQRDSLIGGFYRYGIF